MPDQVKGVTGHRPPGGTIEFGETGAATVIREIKEELGVDVVEPRYLGTLENIFTYLGRPGHELVRVYEARFADPQLYERDVFECVEANGAAFSCVRREIDSFSGDALYPAGLLALLRAG